jgi:hypothetical protein
MLYRRKDVGSTPTPTTKDLLRGVRSLVSGEFHKLLPFGLEGSNPSPATNLGCLSYREITVLTHTE